MLNYTHIFVSIGKNGTLCFVRNECFARYNIVRVLMIQLVSNSSIYYRVNPLCNPL